MAQRPREENNCARDRRGTRQYGEDFISLGQEEVPPRDAMALYVSLDRRNLDGRCLRTQTPEGSKPKSGPRERSENGLLRAIPYCSHSLGHATLPIAHPRPVTRASHRAV